MHIKNRLKEKGIQKELVVPKKRSYYRREILPLITGNYNPSSSDESESETERRRVKEERKAKRKAEKLKEAEVQAKLEKKLLDSQN